ncbi:MAG: hypothetical protein IJ025_04370 [Clostridia bacterium]|nr:hypothetical protein [Clostridia bacterium]
MSRNIEERVECPFFLRHSKTAITCEGVLDGTNCVHTFKSAAQRDFYETGFCCVKGGRSCQHYRNVSILYERGLKV